MEHLNRHEAFEIEVLEGLSKQGFLRPLVFVGGTMLRLCHELPRYSVDLDFWLFRKVSIGSFHTRLSDFLAAAYRLTDAQNKHFTLIYEFAGKASPRKLKIEIRKEILTKGTEQKIAYSSHSSTQVLVRAITLEQCARMKIEAIRNRNEVRDYFDMEFLIRNGIDPVLTEKDKALIQKQVSLFKKTDYSVALGSLLKRESREYYVKNGFTYLLEKIGSR